MDPRDNRPKLMEINPRFWGSPFAVCVCWCRFSLSSLQDGNGEAFKPVTTYKTGLRSRYLLPGDIMHFFSNPERFKMRPGFFNFFDKTKG